MSRYSNYSYCIRSDNLDLIEQAVTHIFEQEDCRRIPLPPLSLDGIELSIEEIETDVKKLRRYNSKLSSELWAFGVFVGALEWTIVKTFPDELLCRRAKDAERPRLSELAIQLRTDAFYIGYGEEGSIFMETDAKGGIFISGSVNEEHSEEGKFFEEQINLVDRIQSLEQKAPQRFFLLNVPEQMQTAEQELKEEEDKRFEEWQEQFLDDYTKRYFSLMTFDKLEKWKVRFRQNRNQLFNKKGGKQLFRAWSNAYTWQDFSDMPSGFLITFERAIGRLLGGTPSYWHLGREPLVYRAYTQQKQLETDGARLLYFPPTQ
ncbi:MULTISPECIES: hypothetical protein [unclassified Nostoc]|uniref:hypothetical protein n=1 Tax=unclassified Nostoc TaxID=2593658 RepID=UPI000B95A3A9|nr:hypothetical protein [Nostoc sp. 'Peltigera membranacea cyanobiont' 232]OYE06157.1 hypothetical protein CDG79_04280 [Nostoc sp. 'Peltigera membranacea cyanobiont' 232]